MTIEQVLRDGTLHCPVCGMEFNHIQCVYTRKGADENEAIIYDGTRSIGTVPNERRSCLVIELTCENCGDGHRWELRLQQRKGNIFVEAEGVGAAVSVE